MPTRRLDLAGPLPTRLGLGALGAGVATLAFTDHGPAYGVPTAWVAWPSMPGAIGTFLVGFGLALLTLLALTGNLARPHRQGLLVAGALLAAALALGLVPGYQSHDVDLVLPGLLVAASVAAAVWGEPRARPAGLVGAALLAILALALHLASHTYGVDANGQYGPLDAGVRWMIPVERAITPYAGLVAGLALLAGALLKARRAAPSG